MTLTVRDVTLREYGQNVPSQAVKAFSLERRLWLARALIDAGLRTFEVASTASPRVAPAMDLELLRPFVEALGRPSGVELVTLVTGSRGFQRFLDLDLGPDGLRHTMGVFVSAMDEHNLANLGRTVEESLHELDRFVPEARRLGVKVVGYLSAAFGYRPRPKAEVVKPSSARVSELVSHLADFGVETITLSDLQGLADPRETGELLDELIRGPSPCPVPLGYHPHHLSPEAVLDNVEIAAKTGVKLFDASLGAVGGCVTGAPGNAPTEGVVTRLEALGFETGLVPSTIDKLAREAQVRIFTPLAVGDG